ncbi:MAG: hypothetical protein SNJ29_13965 [Rikenellaceae bacterium]
MKAMRVYLDETDTDMIGGVVERLNDFDDTVATMVNAQELFIAACGQCTIKYAECVVRTSFNDNLTIQHVK